MPFSQTLLPEFDAEMKSTRKILECVPDGKFNYQPHERSMTLGRLAAHVAGLPGWAKITIDQDVLDMDPNFKPPVVSTRAELLEMFDKEVAEARPKIEAATDDHWQQIWRFRVAGKELMAMPRSAVMRSVVMNHLIHHRAQLGVYLRLLDVKIPGVYGPSADDPRSW